MNQKVYFKNHAKYWEGVITDVKFALREGTTDEYVPVFTVEYRLNRNQIVHTRTSDASRIVLQKDPKPSDYTSGYTVDQYVSDFADENFFKIDDRLEDEHSIGLDNWHTDGCPGNRD